MSENTPFLSADLPAELRQRQSELAQSLLRHCPRDGIYGTAIEFLVLIRTSGPTLPAYGMHKPAPYVITQGRKEVQLIEKRYIYDPLYYLVVSVTLPLAGQVIDALPDAPYLCVRLDIGPTEITQLISDVKPMEMASRHDDRSLYVDRIDASPLDTMLRLVYLLDSPYGIPMLAPLTLRGIFYRLLRNGQNQRLHEVAIADGQAHHITHVIGWINQNYGKLLRIEQLTQVANLGPSTLHHRFKAIAATNPLQHQKQLRSQEACRLIFNEGLEVATTGCRIGCENPSRLSRKCSRLSDVPPLRDLARARNTAQGDAAAAATVSREAAAYLHHPDRPCAAVPVMTQVLPLLLFALSLLTTTTDSGLFTRHYLAYVHAIGQHSERP